MNSRHGIVFNKLFDLFVFNSVLFVGEDPLDEMTDGRDINSIGGVLKLYLRELREPLFPTLMFDEFIACCRKSGCSAYMTSMVFP